MGIESQIFEAVGRKQMVIEAQDLAYGNLLDLLAGVVTGKVSTSRILVNLTNRTWELAAPGQSPQMPATINGLPVCVTGWAAAPEVPASPPPE